MLPTTTSFMAQTPTMSLHQIADLLWLRGEHAAYRALQAYIKERDAILKELKELKEIK